MRWWLMPGVSPDRELLSGWTAFKTAEMPRKRRPLARTTLRKVEMLTSPVAFTPSTSATSMQTSTSKLGWGRYSTVWLVKDLSKEHVQRPPSPPPSPKITRPNDEHRFRALKVLSDECYGHEHPIFEREILRRFRDGSRKLLGYKYVCHLVDDFELTGPNGTHVCLVLELMGETLASFGVWFPDDRVPTLLMRKFSFQLVCALDFAHENEVIHTGRADHTPPFEGAVELTDHRRYQTRQHLHQGPRHIPD